jgi:murein DD-endopeptidase MepM/ murein hydrolase activator NlpD
MNLVPVGRATARRVTRRTAIAGGLAAASTPWWPGVASLAPAAADPAVPVAPDTEGMIVGPSGTRAFGYPEPDMTSQIVRPIVFPVRGPVKWTDTYGACRGDGCSRRHEGQDLMAAKMQELVACVDGTVVGLKYSAEGNYLFLRDSAGWHYGYLHINNDTPGTDDGANRYDQAFASGIVMGARVRQGQVIAYVGDSGNAESTAPHCHFEIRKPAGAWYDAQAINPKYSLAAAHAAPPSVDPKIFTPWASGAAFVSQQYLDILGRSADAAGLRTFSSELDRGVRSPPSLVLMFLQSPEFNGSIGPVIRLYLGYFGRPPDAAGLLYWIEQVRHRGFSAYGVSDVFARSSEFVNTYGALDNAGFVDRIYANVLQRPPDAGGRAYWVDLLNRGVSRGTVMLRFTESVEFAYRQHPAVLLSMLYVGMLRRNPDSGGYMYWLGQLQSGATSWPSLITQFQFSSEYRRRFA